MIILSKIPDNLSSVFYESNKFSIHAEKDAIKGVKNKSDMAMILIVKLVDNKLVQAFPCDMCTKLLLKHGFNKMLNYNHLF